MTRNLFVFACALLQCPISVGAAGSDDCQTGSCMPGLVDDASALMQSRAKVSRTEELSSFHDTAKDFLKAVRQDRLEATQTMEKSMQSAVEGMVANGKGPSVSQELVDLIQKEMESLRGDLVDEHKNFQQQMDDAAAAVKKCNTHMRTTEGDSVADAKEVMDARKTTHHDCREAEVNAYDAKEDSCDTLVQQSEKTCTEAPSCGCAPGRKCDPESVLACLEEQTKWVEINKKPLKAQKSDCDTKTTTWSSKADTCDTDQSNYELAFCMYAEHLDLMCLTHATCYDEASAEYASTTKLVEVQEQDMKAMMASAKKLVCYLSVLVKGSSGDITMSHYEVCKTLNISSDTDYLKNTVEDMKITYTSAAKQETCETVSTMGLAEPGDGQWVTQEYSPYNLEWLRETAVCSHKTTTITTTTQARQAWRTAGNSWLVYTTRETDIGYTTISGSASLTSEWSTLINGAAWTLQFMYRVPPGMSCGSTTLVSTYCETGNFNNNRFNSARRRRNFGASCGVEPWYADDGGWHWMTVTSVQQDNQINMTFYLDAAEISSRIVDRMAVETDGQICFGGGHLDRVTSYEIAEISLWGRKLPTSSMADKCIADVENAEGLIAHYPLNGNFNNALGGRALDPGWASGDSKRSRVGEFVLTNANFPTCQASTK